jgi:DNA (cytosine-5)-methyltransferase 1
MSFTSVDLFAGIGGFRIAVERCGGRCIAFSEIAPDAIKAYLDNHPGSTGANMGDITAIAQLPQADFLSAGVPCQSWSIAGKNLGFDDDRGQLWNDALFLLNQSRPKAFLFENVKGLSDPRNKHALRYIHERIREAGYHAAHYVLNAFDYGVPQSRVRIYIIGFREERFFRDFKLPNPARVKVRLRDIMDDFLNDPPCNLNDAVANNYSKLHATTSLSANNNGFNDYFIFNDIRNGLTTIHSWDMMPTTQRQKDICLLLLRNRRKRDFGTLDGNPLSLAHFQSFDNSISQAELDELVALGILKTEKYSFRVSDNNSIPDGLTDAERLILSKQACGTIVPDHLVCDREIKKMHVKISEALESLVQKNLIACNETRYEFRYTKISTGLDGICRIFLPSSSIFPTLVASDTNDYLTPVYIPAFGAEEYKKEFLERVLAPKQYRKISRAEACRIQGFSDDFILPEPRPRWMKLLGNSIAVPLGEKLVQAVVDTGVFEERPIVLARKKKPSRELPTWQSSVQPSLFD